MAEGFEPYHVPQQSRRDKLRVVNHHHQPLADTLQTCASLLPLYDPSSLIPSDFISCAAANLHRHPYNIAVKEEGMGINLMGFVDGMSTSHDPHQSVHLNPSSTIQDVNSTSYVYASSPHCYLPFHGDQLAAPGIFKPLPQTSTGGQSLSLSLSSHCSNLNLPLELNMHRYDSSPVFTANKVSDGYLVSCNGGEGGAAAVEFSKSSVPLGPFTGYASVLRGSRFLKPAQQLLEELCDVGRGIYAEKNGVDSSLLDPPPLETLSGSEIIDDSVNGGDQNGKKSRLLSMLDEVYKWYKQYYQQMQAAVAAFESVAGLSNAAPFANMALNVMSKHFRCLRNAIADQLQQFSSKPHGKMNFDRDENSSWRPFHVDQPVWRPQRGLPERAVTVLRAWLFEHFLHPYPTDTDKVMLAKQTGLSRNQVSNWFINARVRLWKPMVEEIHMLETRQGQKPSQIVEHPAPNSVLDDHLPPSCSVECEDASTSVQRTGDFPLKRSREEGSAGAMGQMKLPYDHHHHHMGVVGLNNGNHGAVSLTLGLHQNDPYPLNAARRFGLDSQGVVSESRQFGRPMMHDFVG